MTRVKTAAVLVLAAVLLAAVPTALASHTMGHRYNVFGRIIDSNGMPVQNQTVEIRIYSGDTALAGIVTGTNCLGDFQNWDGHAGSVPPAGGKVEANHKSDGTAYEAFHFHDSDLSDLYKVRIIMADGENWTEAFHSKTRATAVAHQLSHAASPTCGSYDQFNSTFTARVSILARDEWVTGEQVPRARHVDVRLGGDSGAPTMNGTTDFNGAFQAQFTNVTLAQGETIHVQATDLGSKSYSLDAQTLKFRRLDSVNELGASVAGVLNDARNFGIFALIVIAIGAIWYGSGKLRGRMEERRLRQTSTRRRFRKEKNP